MTKASDAIRAELTENARHLQEAQADAALLERLNTAKGRVTALQKAGTELTARLNAALAKEAKAEQDAAKAKFRNLSITTRFPEGQTGPSNAIITIRWEGPRWDYQAGRTDWSAFEVVGFPALPPEVFGWIMQFYADQLPAVILDLGEGDADAAMERYFAVLRRGYC